MRSKVVSDRWNEWGEAEMNTARSMAEDVSHPCVSPLLRIPNVGIGARTRIVVPEKIGKCCAGVR